MNEIEKLEMGATMDEIAGSKGKKSMIDRLRRVCVPKQV